MLTLSFCTRKDELLVNVARGRLAFAGYDSPMFIAMKDMGYFDGADVDVDIYTPDCFADFLKEQMGAIESEDPQTGETRYTVYAETISMYSADPKKAEEEHDPEDGLLLVDVTEFRFTVAGNDYSVGADTVLMHLNGYQ